MSRIQGLYASGWGVDHFLVQMLGGRAMKTKCFVLAGSLALILTAASARGQVAIQLVPVSADAPLEQNPTPDGSILSGSDRVRSTRQLEESDVPPVSQRAGVGGIGFGERRVIRLDGDEITRIFVSADGSAATGTVAQSSLEPAVIYNTPASGYIAACWGGTCGGFPCGAFGDQMIFGNFPPSGAPIRNYTFGYVVGNALWSGWDCDPASPDYHCDCFDPDNPPGNTYRLESELYDGPPSPGCGAGLPIPGTQFSEVTNRSRANGFGVQLVTVTVDPKVIVPPETWIVVRVFDTGDFWMWIGGVPDYGRSPKILDWSVDKDDPPGGIPDEWECRDCYSCYTCPGCDWLMARAEANAEVTISLVPVSGDAPPEQNPTPEGWSISGNEIIMESGGRNIWLEIKIGDWDPDDAGVRLRAWQATLVEPGGYSSGLQGTLTPLAAFPCTTDAECEGPFGTGARCSSPGAGYPGICRAYFIGTSRTDYVFFGVPAISGATSHIYNIVNFGGHVLSLEDAADDPEPFPPEGLYAGTLVLEVPTDALGTFTVGPLQRGYENALSDQNFDFIPLIGLVPAQITVELGQCCYGVNTEQPECIDAVTRDECNAQQRSYFILGNTCADECLDCLLSSPPTPAQIPGAGGNLVVSTTNRFLSFSAGDRYRMQAARVTFVDLPAPYDIWNGSNLWVGAPSLVSEDGGTVDPQEIPPTFPTFSAATLTCAGPVYLDWNALGVVHVLHEGIVPQGVYHIQMIDEICSPSAESNFSNPLQLTQAKWGDTLKDCTTDPCGPPDGVVRIVDIVGILGRFASLPGSITKARADLEPACLDLKINITDVVQGLWGFVGVGYPFGPSAPQACDSTCPNPLPR